LDSGSLLHPLGIVSISCLADAEITKRLTTFNTAEDWEMLAEFINKNIIKTGRILGVERDQIEKDDIFKNKQIARCYLNYTYFSEIGKIMNHF